MRYVLAIAALVLSGVLLLLGVGQRTFLAPPSEIVYSTEEVSHAHYAVIPGAELENEQGQPSISVSGANAFVAVGSAIDVQAWVQPFDHVELHTDPTADRLKSTLIPGERASEYADNDEAENNISDQAEDPQQPTAPAETQPENGAPTLLDPRGSDLWLEERAIDEKGSGVETDTLRMPTELDDTQAVLIATNGQGPLPEHMSIVWAQDRNTPWAGPLLVSGGVFGLVGGILYLIALDHDRRGLGPRRGRQGVLLGVRGMFWRNKRSSSPTHQTGATQRTVLRTLRAPVLGLALLTSLTGCSASYWPDFSAPPADEETEEQNVNADEHPEEPPYEHAAEETAAPPETPPVTDEQLDHIVSRIADTSQKADEKLDAKLLAERFTDDALTQRTANYKIRKAIADYSLIPPRITGKTLDYELIQSTETWPRTILVTVASETHSQKPAETEKDTSKSESKTAEADPHHTSPEEASPSLALVLTQDTPHQNYLVSQLIALRGGISMTQIAPAEEGAALLAENQDTLALAPEEVGLAFSEILQHGKDVPEARYFDLSTDMLTESYGKTLTEKAQKKADSEEKTLTYSVNVAPSHTPPVALSTGMGGALVATTITEQQTVDGSAGTYRPQATDVITALSGLTGQQEKLVQTVTHQMLFFVPSKTAGSQIQLLGVTSEIVGASK